MAETVSDILGKGLKFENRVIVELLPPASITGTIPAFVGCANWGPKGSPILINKDITRYIGTPVVAESESDSRVLDYAGLAAEHHLKNSQYCYFTRVSDGTDKKASVLIRRAATSAKLVGASAVQNTSALIDETNNSFKIKYGDLTSKTITIDSSPKAVFAVDISGVTVASLVGRRILITIDDNFLSYTINGTETNLASALATKFSTDFGVTGANYIYKPTDVDAALLSDEDSFIFVDQTNSTLYLIEDETSTEIVTTTTFGTVEPVDPENEQYFFNTSTKVLYYSEGGSEAVFEEVEVYVLENNFIVLESQRNGSLSYLTIHDFPGTVYNENNVKNVAGSDSSINSIVSYINSELDEDVDYADKLLVGFDSFRKFQVTSIETGVDISFVLETVTNDIYSTLLINEDVIDEVNYGTDEQLGGKVEAYYTGTEGNSLSFMLIEEAYGDMIQFYWGSSIIGSFFGYSYNVADSNFIGTMVNNDEVTSQYVKFYPLDGITSIPTFEPSKLYTLSGGTSGADNLTDQLYISALQEYKNLDLYDIDLIACPGMLGEDIVNALIEVCAYRQDAFNIIDTPQQMSPYQVERWHNGLDESRSAALDSEYSVLYYPWVMISTPQSTLAKQWVPASVRAIGTITTCDLKNQNKYSIPAGHENGKITDVEGIELYLTEEEKQRLYADRLNNNINPIVYNKNLGYFIDGQKTTKKGLTPINRLKSMRAALWIKRQVASIAPNYFWKPIDSRTRASLEFDLNTILAQLAADRVIKTDYVVDVSEELNDEYIEAQGGLVARMEWYPIKAVEKIKIINVIRDKQVSFAIEI